MNKCGNGKGSGSYWWNKGGSYKGVCKGDGWVYSSWWVYSYRKGEDGYIYMEGVNGWDGNWICGKDWGNSGNKEKVNVWYEVGEGKWVSMGVMGLEIEEYDWVLVMERGGEYKLEEVISLDKGGRYRFVGKGNKEKKGRLVMKEYNVEVKINCSGERGSVSGEGEGEVYRSVVCCCNDKDFISDVRLVGEGDWDGVGYEFRSCNGGSYIFEGVKKRDVRCRFEVSLGFDVEGNELVWKCDDIRSKSLEIDIGENRGWRIRGKGEE